MKREINQESFRNEIALEIHGKNQMAQESAQEKSSAPTLAPGKIAHGYALMAWNGVAPEEAKEMVKTTDFDKLNDATYASDSVMTAKAGIEKHLLKGEHEIAMDYITTDLADNKDYFYEIGNSIAANFETEEELCDSIINILEDIHDKWVVDNAKKYNRDAEANDKRLFQHLPTALIGLNEVAKDLMFLAPILKQCGYEVGKMTNAPYGEFAPSNQIALAYDRYVANYKQEHNIQTEQDLVNHLSNITNEYSALAPTSEIAGERVAYMQDEHKALLLAEQVKSKNDKIFAQKFEAGLER